MKVCLTIGWSSLPLRRTIADFRGTLYLLFGSPSQGMGPFFYTHNSVRWWTRTSECGHGSGNFRRPRFCRLHQPGRQDTSLIRLLSLTYAVKRRGGFMSYAKIVASLISKICLENVSLTQGIHLFLGPPLDLFLG
jgi:hypothetical protein